MKHLTHYKNQLQEIKPELFKKFHVTSIGLFGSVVKNTFRIDSDLDVVVDFNKNVGIEFIDLAEYLEEKLKIHIDLVSKNGIKEKYFKAIESEIIYV